MNIYVQPVAGNAEPVRITAEKDRDIPDYFWKGGDRIVYTKDVGGDENDHVLVVDRRGGAPKDVTPYPGVKAQVIDALVQFPNRMLIGLNRRVREVFDAYELDLARARQGRNRSRRSGDSEGTVGRLLAGRRRCRRCGVVACAQATILCSLPDVEDRPALSRCGCRASVRPSRAAARRLRSEPAVVDAG